MNPAPPTQTHARTRSPLFVGIDIAKASMEVAAGDLQLNLANDSKGFAELLAAVRRLRRRVHFICEHTSYARKLGQFLHTQRCALSFVHPYHVRQFAKASGQIAKTDAIDARVLAEFGATFRPERTPKPDKTLARLTRLARRRRQLARVLALQKLQFAHLLDRDLQEDTREFMKHIETCMVDLDRRLERIIEETPRLANLVLALSSVVGMGRTSAIGLICELPEIGRLNRQQVAALAGVAPMNWDTGILTGQRHIRGGRAPLRTLLFMPACHAARADPVLSVFFKRLRAAGKPYHVALIAVLRKYLIYLNHVARHPEIAPLCPKSSKVNGKVRKWTTADVEALTKMMTAKTPAKLAGHRLQRAEGSVKSKMAEIRAVAAGMKPANSRIGRPPGSKDSKPRVYPKRRRPSKLVRAGDSPV
jgi:transposase